MTSGIASPAAFLAPQLVLASGGASVGDVVTLAASRCTSCGRVEFPVRTSCPVCASETATVGLSQTATVRAFTQVEHPPPGCLVEVPYVVVMADFPEGVTVLGRLVGVTLEEVVVGDAVVSAAVAVGEGLSYGFQIDRERP